MYGIKYIQKNKTKSNKISNLKIRNKQKLMRNLKKNKRRKNQIVNLIINLDKKDKSKKSELEEN